MIAASIAFRNLFLHRAKTVMIGTIMGLGIMTLFVGNSLIDTAVDGLARVFVRGYTGDFMITGPTLFPTTVFAQTPGGEDVVPHIQKAESLVASLESRSDVRLAMPMLSGQTEYGLGEEPVGELPLFGIDSDLYRKFFPDNIEIVEGDWPAGSGTSDPASGALASGTGAEPALPGAGSGAGTGTGAGTASRAWLMLPEAVVEKLSARAGHAIHPGDMVTLSAAGDYAGTVIREVELSAVFRFRQGNRDLARMGLADADSVRDLLGFASLRDKPMELTETQRAFVEDFNPDLLFGESEEPGSKAPGTSPALSSDSSPLPAQAAPAPAPAPTQAPAATATVATEAERGAKTAGTLASDPGLKPDPAWQFILVSMERGKSTSPAMKSARAELKTSGVEARVQGWVESAGTVARNAMTVRLAFDLLVLVVAIVVVIVTMNALVVSIGERIAEIGTLRAIGARRSFVRAMVLWETVFLAGIAGAAGLSLGGVILAILSRAGVSAPNLFFEALFGGPVLIPRISAGAALKAFGWMLAMSLVAAWYPVHIALGIKPVRAMQSE